MFAEERQRTILKMLKENGAGEDIRAARKIFHLVGDREARFA